MRHHLGPLLIATILAAGPLAAQPAPTPLAGLEAPAHVYRDSKGIPHIFADNEHDLYFLQGWVHARDRLFQMDLTRRQASGTLAELLGPEALGEDVLFRTLGLRRAAERSLAQLASPPAAAALEAYAAGVNAYAAAHPLPPEYGPLEITAFAPWTAVDTVVVGKLLAFGLSFDLDLERTLALESYVAAGDLFGFDGAALFAADLFRSAPFDPAATVPDATGNAAGLAPLPDKAAPAYARRLGSGVRRLPEAALELARRFRRRAARSPALRAALSPGERVTGSNEWAVAGSRTAGGFPLLANDPHLALDMPATFYQIHLRSRGGDGLGRQDVIGSGFPGTPFVVLGHNRRIAWGATTNPLDVTDTFMETVVPAPGSPSGLGTVHGGQVEPLIPVPVAFRYNRPGDGQADNLATAPPGGQVGGTFIPPVVLLVPRRGDGPIIEIDPQAGVGLSVQYAGFAATRELVSFYSWNKARNLDEFRDGLRFFDVGSQNWVYADVEGNIAYFTSGEMPLREDLQAGTVNGLPPFFLRDGGGGNEWIPRAQPGQVDFRLPYQTLPAEEMPQLINPPADWLVNANNDPAGTTLDNDPLNQLRPGGGIYYLSPGYAAGFRAGRITGALAERLAARPVTAADMQALQADTQLLDAQVFVPTILAAFDRGRQPGAHPALAGLAADPRVAEAVERLEAWDFTTPTGIPEGFDAADVEGVRQTPSDAEIADSVAATLYSVWRGRMIANTIDATLDPLGLPTPPSQLAMTALRNLLDSFPAQGGVGLSGLDFFPAPPGADAETRRDWTVLRSLTDALDRLAGQPFAKAFGRSTDQGDYRWGLLHRIVFHHPFGRPFNVPAAGGAFPQPLPGLPGVPVDGGFGTVDASSHSARADGVFDFMFGSGPVRRFVGETGPGPIRGRTSLPGGESGVLASPFYVNLLPLWLTDDTYELLYFRADVIGDLASAELFVPGE